MSMPCAGRHYSPLQRHVRKSFTSRRPHSRLWKKYSHEDSDSEYGKEQYSDDVTDSYSEPAGTMDDPKTFSGGNEDAADVEVDEEKPATGYGRQYNSGHRLDKHLLHKHFSQKSYNPLSKWGPGYEATRTHKSKGVKSWGHESGSSYDSGSGHDHVKPFHSRKKLFLKHLFSKKGHKAVDVDAGIPHVPMTPEKDHDTPKGHHASVFAGGYSRSSHNKGSLRKKFIHKKIFFKGTHKPWPVVTKTHHEMEEHDPEYGPGYEDGQGLMKEMGTGYGTDAGKDQGGEMTDGKMPAEDTYGPEPGYGGTAEDTTKTEYNDGEYDELDIPATGFGGDAGTIDWPNMDEAEIVKVYVDPEAGYADGAGYDALPESEPEYTATYNTGY